MVDRLREFTSPVKDWWRELNTVKKASVILVTISVILVLGVTSYFANKTSYVTLFAEIPEAEAGAVVKELETQGIKYKLEHNGSTILVDAANRDKFRMDLALENKLPSSATGFEIFDETSMMATDEDRKIMYQRAVTGELQKAIEVLDGVKQAKVMLVLPDKSIFEKKSEESSASIVLTLGGNQGLTEAAIQGIATLVTGAVENLPLKNVKIVDAEGNLLSEFLSEDQTPKVTDLASKYQVLKQDYEKNLESKTTALLESVFAEGKVKLSINVDLDFDSIEKTTVTYEKPEKRSESVKASGGNVNVQEIQGGNINDNLSNVVGATGEANDTYEHSINNELDTETTKVINAPGVVKKISASVLINETLTPVESQKLREIIESAIGFERERGDQVAIQGFKFSGAEATEAEVQAKLATSWFETALGKQLILVVLILLGLIILCSLVVFFINRQRKKQQSEAVEELELDVTSQMVPDLGAVAEVVVATPPTVEVEPVTTSEPSEPKVKAPMVEEEIEKRLSEAQLAAILQEKQEQEQQNVYTEKEHQAKRYAQENPDLAAELIKVWMKDK